MSLDPRMQELMMEFHLVEADGALDKAADGKLRIPAGSAAWVINAMLRGYAEFFVKQLGDSWKPEYEKVVSDTEKMHEQWSELASKARDQARESRHDDPTVS